MTLGKKKGMEMWYLVFLILALFLLIGVLFWYFILRGQSAGIIEKLGAFI